MSAHKRKRSGAIIYFGGVVVIAAAIVFIGGSTTSADRQPEPDFDFRAEGPVEQGSDSEQAFCPDFWIRPDGPPKVALQAGHWKANEVPGELANLRTNGAWGGGLAEWEVNLAIAIEAAMMIGAAGVAVEVLPTTIPPDYYADAFVAIHTDDSPDHEVSGYKAAASGNDLTGTAQALAELLDVKYRAATGMQRNPHVTEDMSDYYAFNWRRYEHSLHPMTPAAILEVGFMTSPDDRQIIFDDQRRAAAGIADAVLEFLGVQ